MRPRKALRKLAAERLAAPRLVHRNYLRIESRINGTDIDLECTRTVLLGVLRLNLRPGCSRLSRAWLAKFCL
jgi:hypothetical protein